MTVVVLSICPEKLRGELTRWLLEISTGVYVGHVTARVRERLWWRILEDVGKGRALMVYATRSEQGLTFRAHNHSWTPVDIDGLTLMRRPTAESHAMANAFEERRITREGRAEPQAIERAAEETGSDDVEPRRHNWSKSARRRRFRNEVERRHERW